MYQPETYWVALLFMVLSMLCWGSWANTMKLTAGYAFQLFYWDYVIGALATSIFWGFTLGSIRGGGTAFLASIHQADRVHVAWALAGGVLFNIANLLLVAAIDIAGLAVAFPVGIGLALVVGVLLNFLITPRGNPFLLFGGVALVVLAIVLNAMAYRRREIQKKALSLRGIEISVACGILMGISYPFVVKAITGDRSLGPYAVSFVFALGIALCTIPVNYFFMRKPLTASPPVDMKGYVDARGQYHLWGIMGGVIWCTGTTLNFTASHAQLIGPAISYAIGQGATMVSAIWGVFVWREFSDAPASARKLILPMFVCFIIGLVAVAVAPVLVR
jgi:glucose uptake protein